MAAPTSNSFAPPRSAVADVTEEGEVAIASRGSRLAAVIVDGLIFTIPFGPSYFSAIPAFIRAGGAARGRSPFGVWYAVANTGGWFYIGGLVTLCTLVLTAVLVHRNGQTIGKKLLGIKVVRSDGSKATLARIFWIRYLANTLLTLIPLIGSLYGLIDCLFIFGASKRCCHDYLADTIVVQA